MTAGLHCTVQECALDWMRAWAEVRKLQGQTRLILGEVVVQVVLRRTSLSEAVPGCCANWANQAICSVLQCAFLYVAPEQPGLAASALCVASLQPQLKLQSHHSHVSIQTLPSRV